MHKKFIFNEKIDQNWLLSLYGDDYAYITEVFSSSLESLNEDLPLLTNAFESSDLSGLKKAAHKLKPVFGFTGLMEHQEMTGRFENTCMSATSTGNLTLQYIELMDLIREGKNIIQEDYNRLTMFIA